MFNILKKDKVTFACTQSYFTKVWPPVYSKDLQRPFLKKCNEEYKRYINELKQTKCPFGKARNTARCNGIIDMISTGYIIRLHRDIRITTYGDGEKFFWEKITCDLEPQTTPEVGWFAKDQYADHLNMPPNTLKSVLKINTPWVLYSDDYCFIQTHPSFFGEHRFTVVEGVLDPLKSREINVIMFWHVLDGVETLEAGTPLCQLIPIKRKDLPKLEIVEDYKNMRKNITDFLIVKNSTSFSHKEPDQKLFGI